MFSYVETHPFLVVTVIYKRERKEKKILIRRAESALSQIIQGSRTTKAWLQDFPFEASCEMESSSLEG